MLNLEAWDLAIALYRAMRGRLYRVGNGYNLYKDDVVATIIQSRAYSSNGRVITKADQYSDYSATHSYLGCPIPFTVYVRVLDYNAVAITYTNCV